MNRSGAIAGACLLAVVLAIRPCHGEEGGQASEQEIEALLPRLVVGVARGGAPPVRELLERVAQRLSLFADEASHQEKICASTVFLVSPASKTLFGDRYALTSLAGRDCEITLVVGDDARGLKDARVETMAGNAQEYEMDITCLRLTDNGWQQASQFQVMPRRSTVFPVGKDLVYEQSRPFDIGGTTDADVLDAAKAIQCRPHLAEGRLSCSSERHLKLYRDVITDVHVGAPAGAVTTLMIRTCPWPKGPAVEPLAVCSWMSGSEGRKSLLDTRFTADSLATTKAQILVLRQVKKQGTVHFEQREATLAGSLWIMKTINRYDRKPAKPDATP